MSNALPPGVEFRVHGSDVVLVMPRGELVTQEDLVQLPLTFLELEAFAEALHKALVAARKCKEADDDPMTQLPVKQAFFRGEPLSLRISRPCWSSDDAGKTHARLRLSLTYKDAEKGEELLIDFEEDELWELVNRLTEFLK